MILHKSLETGKFVTDKKLMLLRKGVITFSQFISLIQADDPYTIIGPAVVAKTHINQFIEEWKNQTVDFSENNKSYLNPIKITQEDIIAKIPELISIFPQINSIATQLLNKLNTNVSCPTCEKNKYILLILGTIRQFYNDGRDLHHLKQFIEQLLFKYYPMSNKVITIGNIEQIDIDWIKPDSLLGLGKDLIQGLNACFDCAKKHLGRAKAFYEEWLQGYPEHSTLMYKQFTISNEVLERGYALFWDSLSQLDMASSELVGNIVELQTNYKIEIIQLANKIRFARIKFQEDSEQIPDWNQLRIEIQKLQNKVNKVNLK